MVQEIKFLIKIFGIAFFLGMMVDIILGRFFKHAFWLFVISTALSLLISFTISELIRAPVLITFVISAGVWISFISGTRLNYLYEKWRERENQRHKEDRKLNHANI